MREILHKRFYCGLLLFAVVLLTSPRVGAQTYKDHEIKAAFMINFGKFIEWPQESLSGNEFVIGVLGDDYFKGTMELMVKNKKISNKTFCMWLYYALILLKM